ncbi:MBOAT family protein [Dactylonectria macrodidyma]|uniref:MBOAT family protein n=1 Tax=Dactylonectria macrodidyma TaxID=307937 RepID=A0A9P9IWW0_9HYPO|nr:MBOAT family protein [Dactylonectria macrodidyma]
MGISLQDRRQGAQSPHTEQGASNEAQSRAEPSTLSASEFYLYYFVLIAAVPYMFWIAYYVSRRWFPNIGTAASDPRYTKYERFLSNGWIPGRKTDASDQQLHHDHLPPLAASVEHRVRVPAEVSKNSITEQGNSRLEQRASFDYSLALIFLIVLHGVSAANVTPILYINYKLVKAIPWRYVPLAMWTFNVLLLPANKLSQRYRFEDIARHIASSSSSEGLKPSLIYWGSWLDSYGGLNPRWEVLFNFTILRLISFQPRLLLEFLLQRRQPSLDPVDISKRDHITIPAAPKDYSFRNYVAYAIYSPLYLTGPTLTFNSFISQLRHRPTDIETPRTLRYAIRFILTLIVTEVILHYNYISAIPQATPSRLNTPLPRSLWSLSLNSTSSG